MSTQERYDYNVRKGTALYTTALAMTKVQGGDYFKGFKTIAHAGHEIITPEGNPLGLHFAMFIPALIGQASKKQADVWLTKALNLEILGTYAQTEMGHGTFIRGLETTATYDAKTEQVVINSPSITAYKWWPGNDAC